MKEAQSVVKGHCWDLRDERESHPMMAEHFVFEHSTFTKDKRCRVPVRTLLRHPNHTKHSDEYY